MQFYDPTNLDGLCQEVDRLCDTTDTSYSRLAKTARLNAAARQVESWIITADGYFQWDDPNQSDLPRATFTLQEGIAKYNFSTEFLDVIELEVMDNSGRYHKLAPIDPDELGDSSWDEYFGITSTGAAAKGFPIFYDKNADGIVLGPAPTSVACTLAAGGRITFQRKGVAFTATSATTADVTQPGFASPFHVILAYMAAIPYCMTYKKDRVALYQQTVGNFPVPSGFKQQILEFYARRERDKRNTMTTHRPRHL